MRIAQVSSDGKEREQGADDNPNIDAGHQSNPLAALPTKASAFLQ
jgi:hypothetical protein